MHLRNGPEHDIDAMLEQHGAELKDDPAKSDYSLTNYKKYLNSTGAKQKKADRKPDAAFWGTDAQKIDPKLLEQDGQGRRPPGVGRLHGPGRLPLHPGARGRARTPTCTSSSATATRPTTSGTSSTRTASTPTRAPATRQGSRTRRKARACATRSHGRAGARSTREASSTPPLAKRSLSVKNRRTRRA